MRRTRSWQRRKGLVHKAPRHCARSGLPSRLHPLPIDFPGTHRMKAVAYLLGIILIIIAGIYLAVPADSAAVVLSRTRSRLAARAPQARDCLRRGGGDPAVDRLVRRTSGLNYAPFTAPAHRQPVSRRAS